MWRTPRANGSNRKIQKSEAGRTSGGGWKARSAGDPEESQRYPIFCTVSAVFTRDCENIKSKTYFSQECY